MGNAGQDQIDQVVQRHQAAVINAQRQECPDSTSASWQQNWPDTRPIDQWGRMMTTQFAPQSRAALLASRDLKYHVHPAV
jgi:hypothetical protein